MEHLLWIILAALFSECKGEDRVTQSTGDVIATEGQTVTLDCTFETTSNVPTLFWYKQQDNDFPKYMLIGFSKKVFKAPEFLKDRFDASINKTSVPLKIQKLHLSDSAVYYCALNTENKVVFGTGTRLTIEPKRKYEPSFYKLSDGNTSLCLATDFSRTKAAKTKAGFNRTDAVRISGHSLYNQVALWSGEEDECEEGGPEPGHGPEPGPGPGHGPEPGHGPGPEGCRVTLEPDTKVNMVSLTILGLRLLFLKTIVFNVLMTLRLWISH